MPKTLIKLLLCLIIPNLCYALLALLISILYDITFTFHETIAYTSLCWIPFLYIYYKKTGTMVSFRIGEFSYSWVLVSVIIGCCSFGLLLLANLIRNGGMPTSTNSLLTSILLITITPAVEELFFRKWIYHFLSKHGMSVFTTGLLSSLLFYITHWLPFSEYLWFYRVDTLILGICLCLLYQRTHNIRYCILAHMIVNLLGQLI